MYKSFHLFTIGLVSFWKKITRPPSAARFCHGCWSATSGCPLHTLPLPVCICCCCRLTSCVFAFPGLWPTPCQIVLCVLSAEHSRLSPAIASHPGPYLRSVFYSTNNPSYVFVFSLYQRNLPILHSLAKIQHWSRGVYPIFRPQCSVFI